MALAALGLLFTFDNLGMLDAEDYLRFGWPVALIAYGTLNLVGTRTGGGRLWGTTALVAGIALMGQRLGLWHAELRAFAPLLLVLLGGYIVWQSMRSDGTTGAETSREWRLDLRPCGSRPRDHVGADGRFRRIDFGGRRARRDRAQGDIAGVSRRRAHGGAGRRPDRHARGDPRGRSGGDRRVCGDGWARDQGPGLMDHRSAGHSGAGRHPRHQAAGERHGAAG